MWALTVKAPWGSLIEWGEKQYETRTYEPGQNQLKPGDLVAIHQGKAFNNDQQIYCHQSLVLRALVRNKAASPQDELPFGKVLCLCEFQGATPVEQLLTNDMHPIGHSERLFGFYEPGWYGWKLKVIHRFNPYIPARGQLRLWQWNMPDEALRQVAGKLPVAMHRPVQLSLF